MAVWIAAVMAIAAGIVASGTVQVGALLITVTAALVWIVVAALLRRSD